VCTNNQARVRIFSKCFLGRFGYDNHLLQTLMAYIVASSTEQRLQKHFRCFCATIAPEVPLCISEMLYIEGSIPVLYRRAYGKLQKILSKAAEIRKTYLLNTSQARQPSTIWLEINVCGRYGKSTTVIKLNYNCS
jgi:hypothetical protein